MTNAEGDQDTKETEHANKESMFSDDLSDNQVALEEALETNPEIIMSMKIDKARVISIVNPVYVREKAATYADMPIRRWPINCSPNSSEKPSNITTIQATIVVFHIYHLLVVCPSHFKLNWLNARHACLAVEE